LCAAITTLATGMLTAPNPLQSTLAGSAHPSMTVR
jgi:hypothetical protein